MTVEIGDAAPSFTLPDQRRNAVSLTDFRGSKTLVVFIPFPFTKVCEAELCDLRDNLHRLDDLDGNAVVITTHAVPTNARWASEQGFESPILADYWPHGAVARAYGCFNDQLGVAMRSTYVVDEDGTIADIVASDGLGIPRSVDDYWPVLTG